MQGGGDSRPEPLRRIVAESSCRVPTEFAVLAPCRRPMRPSALRKPLVGAAGTLQSMANGLSSYSWITFRKPVAM